MSVRIMSLVYSVVIGDLEYTKKDKSRKSKASTAKAVLQAYADNANDDGIATYPGYITLMRKTEISRQGLADTIDALKQCKLLKYVGKSPRGTNEYAINVAGLRALREAQATEKAKSSHLTLESQATLLPSVKWLDLNHPIPILKPSDSTGDDKNIYQLYEENIGALTPLVADALQDLESDLSAEWVAGAIAIAAKANARNMGYIGAILKRWEKQGAMDDGKKPAGATQASSSSLIDALQADLADAEVSV